MQQGIKNDSHFLLLRLWLLQMIFYYYDSLVS